MISIALYDLKCPSLDYVYDMTWAEFLIRLYGWKREQERQEHSLREMAWVTYIAPHQDPKKMKKSKEAFWPMKKNKSNTVTDDMRAAIKKAQEEYLEQKNKKNG